MRTAGKGRFMSYSILCLVHADHVGAGTTSAWAASRGYMWTSIDLSAGEELPEDPSGFDCIIVTGGPMGVYDADTYPWIHDELSFVRRAIDRRVPLFGLCLGGQLLAAALGADVHRHDHHEIGWWPVRLTAAARDLHCWSHMPDEFTAMMWHGDTFHLPPDAIHLASSAGCARQGFATADGRVIGVQYHPEFDMTDVRRLLDVNELPHTSTQWVSSVEDIRRGHEHADTGRTLWWEMLDRFLEMHQDPRD